MSQELKPCPHCGKTESVILTNTHDAWDDEEIYAYCAVVVCDASSTTKLGGCGASSGCYETEAEAIAAWNSRVSAEGMQEQPEGYVLVPKSALDWLNGEHPDGFEPPADQKLFRGKIPPYWWRSEFRRRIAAAPPAVQETAQTEPTAPNQGASIEVQIFAIEVEKILCSALGRPWSTAGISIETLIAELAARSARVPECGEFGAEQLSISEEQRHQIESLCDSAEMMLNWCVKNVDKWNFSQYDYLHRDVEKTRALLNKKTEV